MNEEKNEAARGDDIIMPSAKEALAIKKAVSSDPDTHLLSNDELEQMRSVEDAIPSFARALRRGAQKAPKKVKTTIRLDADVIDAFKKRGGKWQSEVNEALRKVVGL